MAAIDKDTRNFNIKIENPTRLPGGEVEARVTAKPLGEEENAYDEKIKIKGRSVSEYANNIQEIYGLEEEQKTDLKSDILQMKTAIRNNAVMQGGNDNKAEEEDDLEERFNEVLNHIITHADDGELLSEEKVDALKEEYDIDHLIDEVDPGMDNMVPYNGKLEITDEGRQRVKDYLGFEAFEGDPEAEAQTQLEKDPFRYYLDSFNKIHKGDHLLKIWELLSAMSATCADRQIHSWAVGPSGTGKSHLKRKLLTFLPSEAYEQKESFSPKALQYKSKQEGPGFMDDQLVFFDEVGENIENAIELIRLLTDQDKDVITHETVKDQEIITLTLETGNITVWFTSVDTIQDEQLKNRFILTNPDASSAQDETVNQHQQNILNFGGDLDFIPKEAPVVQRMVRDIRTNTPQYKPIVPFKINWKQEFNRRLYPFFYTLMGMIAKVHYKNRMTRKGHIFVTKADFKLAKLIWGKLIDTTVAQTDEQSIKLLKELPKGEANALKRRELRNRLSGFTTRKVAETCDKLEETEELQLINSAYKDGEYIHWAGADVDKLVDNEPEIRQFNREIVKDMIEEAGLQSTEEILDNIFNEEIGVYNFLLEKVEEKQERNEKEEENNLPEITEEEEHVLKQMKEFDWSADLDSMSKMNPKDEINLVNVATDLEEKNVIRIDEEDMPTATAKLDELKTEGEVVI